MSTKDDVTFSKVALMKTNSGKLILKQVLLREKGYKQYNKYKAYSEKEFPEFTKRFLLSLHEQIISDQNPSSTMKKFVEEIGSPELALEEPKIQSVKSRLSKPEVLADRVQRILNSNFVKMTFPVLNALFDGASEYYKENLPKDIKNSLIDGHIIAIDLSEPMDRILDNDEDKEFLEDYKLMNPYILEIARQKISVGGDAVVKAFEDGFKDARIGQYIDYRLKTKPESVSDENMIGCYKKYRAVMGTAGRNMALNMNPLNEIFHLGMAKAAECAGCGNEMEDAIKNGAIKIPSWPLYYAIVTKDIELAFELTLRKGEIYLEEAKIALEMIPPDLEIKPFLEFLFLTVSHYNQYWFNEMKRRDLFPYFQKNLSLSVRGP
jgi:intein/homing endonuclease